MARIPTFPAGTVSSFVAAIVLAAPLGGRLFAQDLLLDLKSRVKDAFAVHGIAIGDWDGDGIGDIAVGAPHDASAGIDAGAVRIHSGKDGSILAKLLGANGDDLFGTSLARMPDLDGDGIDDLAVGAPATHYAGPDYGSVYLYSGRTGALQRRVDAPAAPNFGFLVSAMNDVDGDGIADLGVDHWGLGEVDVISGADGHEITRITGLQSEDFGIAMSALDDIDGDGARDLLVGAMTHVNSSGLILGAAFVYSGATGALLRTHEGTFNNEKFGALTANLADLDGDGVEDYAVSAEHDDLTGASGMVVVYSGATGAELAKLLPPDSQFDWLDVVVSAAGDLNGDGVGDIAVGGTWTNRNRWSSAVFLFSGKTFRVFDQIDIRNNAVVDLAPFGDLNGDGYGDLLVGSVFPTLNGDVSLYSGGPLWLDATPPVVFSGDPELIETREGVPAALTVLVLEAIDGTTTFQIIGGVQSFDATGGSERHLQLPSGLAGHDFTLRAYANDANGKVVASATQILICK
jgi:hypothetical protein